jgi:hypothetical protein
VYDEQRPLFGDAAQQDPAEFIEIGDSRPENSLPPDELAALTIVCQVILNLDATIYLR